MIRQGCGAFIVLFGLLLGGYALYVRLAPGQGAAFNGQPAARQISVWIFAALCIMIGVRWMRRRPI